MKTDFRKYLFRGLQNPATLLRFIYNLPKFIKLHLYLLKDSRTPFHAKLLLIGALVYVVSPLDVLPDLLIPVIGFADDIIILIAASRYFLKSCPPYLVAEYVQKIGSSGANSS